MDVVSLGHTDNCLRLVDSCLLGREADPQGDVDILRLRQDLPTALVSLCVAADALCRLEDNEQKASGTPALYVASFGC